MTPEGVVAWRRATLARLAAATSIGAREDGDDALVRVRSAAGEAEVALRWDGSRWVLAAAEEWLVKGPALDRANGSGPAKVKLTARKTNDAYGTSAFSFAHVTQDPEQCLNRMDVWYCHNGDLHASGQGVFLEVAPGSLAKTEEIPIGGSWQRAVPAKRGKAYVLHARRQGTRDFFVRLQVTGVDEEGVDLEWDLLSLGEGAPRTIHEPQPWSSPEPGQGRPGHDGCDGLCGRNR